MQITIKNQKYDMKPSWKASVDIETNIGNPIKICQNYLAKDYSLNGSQIAGIIHIGIQAGGADISYDELCESLFEEGVMNYMAEAYSFVFALMQGPEKSKAPESGKKRPQASGKQS